jgi:hypothetical protein
MGHASSSFCEIERFDISIARPVPAALARFGAVSVD